MDVPKVEHFADIGKMIKIPKKDWWNHARRFAYTQKEFEAIRKRNLIIFASYYTTF